MAPVVDPLASRLRPGCAPRNDGIAASLRPRTDGPTGRSPRETISAAGDRQSRAPSYTIGSIMSDNPTVWSVSRAKARFSEVIDQALEQGPQTITRNGRPAVVVVTAEQWARKPGRKSTVADFFAASHRGVRASISNACKEEFARSSCEPRRADRRSDRYASLGGEVRPRCR